MQLAKNCPQSSQLSIFS
ncbi:hypothetical protein EYZ11_003791 [Aspergillus tanneri]|uniref:Uncharacterized protein n=1 Tax=Aspergillus tanneri TaxID=1220188 RepID=A0A4S3JMI8_9EURO|nr:hypothetical protein EYZ11_003791 [Aspergillus tanneri]